MYMYSILYYQRYIEIQYTSEDIFDKAKYVQAICIQFD